MTDHEIVLRESINKLLRTCAGLRSRNSRLMLERCALKRELVAVRKSRDLWKHRALQGSERQRQRERRAFTA